jgi:hypothetical protein
MKITSNDQKRDLVEGTKLARTWTTNINSNKTETRTETYTVTGHINAKNGLRIRLLSEYGYGINDVDFEHKPEFPTLSINWETVS